MRNDRWASKGKTFAVGATYYIVSYHWEPDWSPPLISTVRYRGRRKDIESDCAEHEANEHVFEESGASPVSQGEWIVHDDHMENVMDLECLLDEIAECLRRR